MLLTANGYAVETAPSPPPETPVAAEGANPPETFTVGLTDVTFNPVNAVFGRLLKTREGHVVTLAYWRQEDSESRDDIPYFQK